MRVGLVLGAGGVVGQAWHAGALAALEHHLGWDPRTADVIVGTSAGSLTGALLRSGMPAQDLAAFAVEAPLTPDSRLLGERLSEQPDTLGDFSWRDVVRPWRAPHPTLVARALRAPWRMRPEALVSVLLPSGRLRLDEHLAAFESAAGRAWPQKPLYICAVRQRDGRRVVFGRHGAPPADLPDAVHASCAIPGWFRPARIGSETYVDGGAHSPTNADVLRDDSLDLVVVLSPMSARRRALRLASRRIDVPWRRRLHRRLLAEMRVLESRGAKVVRFEPGASELQVMGTNHMADDRTTAVVQEAFLSTGSRLHQEPVAELLAPLQTRRRRRLRAV